MFSVNPRKGFSLAEIAIGAAIFALVAMSVYNGYLSINRAVAAARQKVVAAALANEVFEIARNMPYADVGVAGSIPSGKLPRTQTIIRDGLEFTVTTTVRNVDDPFDGELGGSPSDTAPADYKLVEVGLECANCRDLAPVAMVGRVSPKNLESASTNGALFIQVFDANGIAVQAADVHVENNSVVPAIVIDDVTNDQGMLQLVDVPPAIEAYEITVTKDGYSTEKTYASYEMPNPVQLHATVVLQAVTQASFAIDRLSSITLRSITPACSPVPNIGFTFRGSKLIGAGPDTYKHSYALSTNSNGTYSSSTIEWDSYTISLAGPTYDIVGTNAVNPVQISPDSVTDIDIILGPKNPKTFLVSVKDGATGLPVSDATVTIGGPFTGSKITGRGFVNQTNWSDGGGQATSSDPDRYYSSDGNVETDLPAGELRLKKPVSVFESYGELISSAFDMGTESNFHELVWEPYSQPAATGPDSVRFQIAANNDLATWNFTGPGGASTTYYTAADRNLSGVHDGNRYIRYKAVLSTADTSTTPNVADVAFTYTTECTPPGQSSWSGLAGGTYSVTVEKPGYQTSVSSFDLVNDWEYYEVTLQPA